MIKIHKRKLLTFSAHRKQKKATKFVAMEKFTSQLTFQFNNFFVDRSGHFSIALIYCRISADGGTF